MLIRELVSEPGVNYERTAKSWMISQPFEHWLTEFDSHMLLEKGRVLLLVDIVSSHESNADLSNVTLQMLPPNTTSFLQPQDASIITAFKACIRKMRVVDLFDGLISHKDEIGEKNDDVIFNVDVLTAIRRAEEAWVGFKRNNHEVLAAHSNTRRRDARVGRKLQQVASTFAVDKATINQIQTDRFALHDLLCSFMHESCMPDALCPWG